MDYNKRRQLYQEIEEHRGRPLIVYVTSTRQCAEHQMLADAVREFIDQVGSIKES